MKKAIITFVLAFFVLVIYLAASSFYTVQDVDLNQLNKCHNTKMNDVFLCPGSGNYTPLAGVSEHFLNLIVIAEDSSFYSHKGFDWHEIKESFKINMRALSYLRGGSTITQQLVKNVFLSPDKSLKRKFIEAMIASKLEEKFSKKMILERYINVIEFGKDIYGITAAAKHYFQKQPSNLNELESAFLVYLVPSPIKYSQVYYNKKLTPWSAKRIKTLLRKLKNFKKISEERYSELVNKVEAFPWDDRNLLNQLIQSQLPPPDEEKIQQEISDEIEQELNEEDLYLEGE